MGFSLFGRSLHFFEVFGQAIERLAPEAAIVIHPVVDFFERIGAQPARTGLGRAAPRDEPGPLEHLQMLRDGGQAQVEGLGQSLTVFSPVAS